MAITEAMIDAGCEQRHGKRAWRRSLKDAGMELWVASRREQMRRILTAAIAAGRP